MFKSWQVFAFSLIPLALVFVGVIVGSIHFSGADSEAEIFPTAGPSTSGGAAPTPVPGATALTVKAEKLLFSPRTLSAAAGQPVQVTLENLDAGVLHNIAFYTNQSATTVIYKSPLEAGVRTDVYTFTAPAAGSYFFRCDVHPDTMTGSFTVR